MVPAVTAPNVHRLQPPSRRATNGAAFGTSLRAALRPVSGSITTSAIAPAYFLPEERQEHHQDQSARRDALKLLDELESLQQDLLRADLTPDRLARMAALAEGLAPVDEELADICAAIALRARVEAARLQRHPSARRASMLG